MSGNDINAILLHVGTPSTYQFWVMFWTYFIGIFAAMHSLSMVFTQGNMNFRCKSSLNSSESSSAAANVCHNNTSTCDRYEFFSPFFNNTIISQFSLVCDREQYLTLSNTIFMATRIPFGLLSGIIIDKLGRKKSIVIGLLLLGVIGVATAYSVNVEMYTVTHALSPFPIMLCYDTCATLLGEITIPKRRPAMYLSLAFSWGLGIMSLSGFSYWLRDWTDLKLAISIPPFLIAIVSFWVLDESPHWLYSQKRYKEAKVVLLKAARWNKCMDKVYLINNLGEMDDPFLSEDSSKACCKIFKSKDLVIILGVTSFTWFACSMGYTGLSIGVTDLIGDIYINNLISGVVEIVAYAIALLVMLGGRRPVFITLLIIGGVGLIANAVITHLVKDMVWLIILTTMIGRLSVSANWQILYIWCLELFPTSLRLSMLQITMITGHIGSTVAPLINKMGSLITDKNIKGEMITPTIYGILLILSALLAVCLPETKDKALPVTLVDVSHENLIRTPDYELASGENDKDAPEIGT